GDDAQFLTGSRTGRTGRGPARADRSQARRVECRAAATARGGRGMSMRSVHVNAAIVGGGPAGMMLGLLLAKRGASVVVLEGHDTFEREFRGEILQPSTANMLHELGLLQYILE